jgi:hypothetical protein
MDEVERKLRLGENLQIIYSFRSTFPDFERVHPALMETLPGLLTKLYSDCQAFAATEINSLLERIKLPSGSQI